MQPRSMRLLMDENVPDSVSEFFCSRGHEVELARDVFGNRTPDQVIARMGDRFGAIVVTWNRRDFQELASRVPEGGRRLLRTLGLITYQCSEVNGRRRTEEL